MNNIIAGLSEPFQDYEECYHLNPPHNTCYVTLGHEFFDILARTAKLTVEYVIPNTTDRYHELVLLVNKTLNNVSAEVYAQSSNRYQLVDFSLPVARSAGYYFFTTLTRRTPSFLVFRPFQTLVWMVIFISALVILGVFKIIDTPTTDSELKQTYEGRSKNFFEPGKYRYVKLSLAILSVTWAYATMVISNSYGSFLISHLLHKGSTLPFQDTNQLADLLLNSNYRIVTDYLDNSSWALQISNGQTQALKKMKKALDIRPPIRVVDRRAVVELVQSNNLYIGVGGSFGTKFFLRDICNITVVEDTEADPRWMSLIYPKNNSRLREAFDRIIPKLVPFYEVLERKYTTNIKPCEPNEDLTEEDKIPLSLTITHDAFVLFCCGMGISLISFALERILSKKRYICGKQVDANTLLEYYEKFIDRCAE